MEFITNLIDAHQVASVVAALVVAGAVALWGYVKVFSKKTENQIDDLIVEAVDAEIEKRKAKAQERK